LWPVFTGGKRIYSGKIGKEIEGAAKNLNNTTIQTQYALMIQAYYSLKLCQEVIKVNNESVNCMTQLYNNAKSLLNNGFINKAELLVAQVAMEEAIRELENSKEAEKVAQNALSTIIGCTGNTHPSSNFFIIADIPSQDYYNQLVIENNSQLKALDNQIGIISQQTKIAKSNYLPNIALFAKQNIYSYNVPKNLSPRTVIGAAAQWTLFDGLNREKSIKVSNLEYNKLLESRTQIEKDLILAAHKLRSNMIEALNNLKVLTSTINLSTELLRVREKSFAEGMANSTDVVTAQTMLAKAKIASHLAYWQFDTSLAALLALCSNIEDFINLYNTQFNITKNSILPTENN
jgi:Outer membrane protein